MLVAPVVASVTVGTPIVTPDKVEVVVGTIVVHVCIGYVSAIKPSPAATKPGSEVDVSVGIAGVSPSEILQKSLVTRTSWMVTPEIAGAIATATKLLENPDGIAKAFPHNGLELTDAPLGSSRLEPRTQRPTSSERFTSLL
jgi:hypothetical protein